MEKSETTSEAFVSEHGQQSAGQSLKRSTARDPSLDRVVQLPDAQVEQDIVRALKRESSIDAGEIVVHVRNGIAILEGSVVSADERMGLERVVLACQGVQDVDNRVTVRHNDQASRISPPM